jgi:hypothetical protein
MAGVAVPFLVLAVLASVVLRFRRSQGEERQQLKWFTFVVAADVVLIPGLGELTQRAAPVLGELVVFPATISLIPLAIGVAVLKYRLYDIDRVINRTLVYGLLTILLGAVYLAGVFGLGQLLNPVGGESALAVAASTLAVAALFQPARRRVQAMVDRRFNRRRYDAVRTVEGFSGRLRDEIDLQFRSPPPPQVRDRRPTQRPGSSDRECPPDTAQPAAMAHGWHGRRERRWLTRGGAGSSSTGG